MYLLCLNQLKHILKGVELNNLFLFFPVFELKTCS